MNLDRERQFLITQINDLKENYLNAPVEEVTQKTEFDLVTNLDKTIEKKLAQAIKEEFPEDTIHGEENASRDEIGNRTWTIDPIDGTCNMASGLPLYGVQCSLLVKGEVALAIIYMPLFDELMVAEKGKGCFLNGKQVKVKESKGLNNALVSFGDYAHNNEELAARQHEAIKEIFPIIAKIRMFGTACLDFLSVAAGRTDATVVITKNLWDIAPGILMCQEAGAVMTNLDGEEYKFGDEGVVASSYKEISDAITASFSK